MHLSREGMSYSMPSIIKTLNHKLPNCMEMPTELSLWPCTMYNKEANLFFIFSSPSLVQIALQILLHDISTGNVDQKESIHLYLLSE